MFLELWEHFCLLTKRCVCTYKNDQLVSQIQGAKQKFKRKPVAGPLILQLSSPCSSPWILSYRGRSPYFHPSLWGLAMSLPTRGTEGPASNQGSPRAAEDFSSAFTSCVRVRLLGQELCDVPSASSALATHTSMAHTSAQPCCSDNGDKISPFHSCYKQE